ncbi:MAG: aldehyde ferredoxin oxidoreductase family protein [Bacteroidales bacterium]|nr:aldehyde ferredoxin oxidoreductase family protein [Bacteroidales bacterium]
MKGYNGILLEIDLTTGQINKKQIREEDLKNYIGGRGLGMKLLYDNLPEPGIDPLSPENPLLFMPGSFCGFPIPSSSRTCVVTKSPRTSSVNNKFKYGSTMSYSNMGGFIGPEIRFAGYDGILIKGKAKNPVYIYIEDDKVEIRDASKYWGMGTDKFDKVFIQDLGDRRFESCYIGPAGENLVPYACVINTAARAAGRGGTGCVMGSKNLKAIAVRGTGIPQVAKHKEYLELLEKSRKSFSIDNDDRKFWREQGTTGALKYSSDQGSQAVKNYSEGTFEGIGNLSTEAARKKIWKRDFACFSCALSCKKSGYAKGAYGTIVHDAPEYETGTMLGANLMIDNLEGLAKLIYVADDYGIDIISTGNTIGFLMECYDKELIDKDFLDGIDLQWGSVDASLQMLHKIGKREGIGELAAQGVKPLADKIGQGSKKFAIHVKGHELAAWNVPAYERTGISYTTANRGACHLNGGKPDEQDEIVLMDSIGACAFASNWYKDDLHYRHFLSTLTGIEWTEDEFNKAGERIFNLEKMMNYREGFDRKDDILPERFYKDKFTYGPKEGAIVNREEFKKIMDEYYEARGWDKETSRPTKKKLEELGLGFLKG